LVGLLELAIEYSNARMAIGLPGRYPAFLY